VLMAECRARPINGGSLHGLAAVARNIARGAHGVLPITKTGTARLLFRHRSSRCGTSALQYRNEVSLALRAPAMTVEVGALFDGESHVMDIGFDVTGGLQGNRLRADDTQDCTTHNHLLARHHPRHSPLLAHEDLGRLNITLYVAINL
jgi:hypothetical protein